MKLTLSESIIKNELNYVVVIAGLVIILGFLYWQYKDKSEKGSYLTNQMDRLSTFTVITIVVLVVLTLVVPSGFKSNVENPSVMLESIELSDSHKGVYFYPKGLNPQNYKDYYMYEISTDFNYVMKDGKTINGSNLFKNDGFFIKRETLKKNGLIIQRRFAQATLERTNGGGKLSDKLGVIELKDNHSKYSLNELVIDIIKLL